jgi:GT2 family glycosyltransferase
VIQPWDKVPATAGRNAFASTVRADVEEFMGGNFSIRRERALALGGFDEKFVQAAYRFEREFSGRVLLAGGRILFEPAATIEHLKAGGGIRAWGEPWASPGHAVGEYYFLLRSPRARLRWLGIAVHPLRAVRTRLHLRRPWLIPATLGAELTAFLWALKLRLGPPGLLPEPGPPVRARRGAGR